MHNYVAPLVGAWIEIFVDISRDSLIKSLPLWERGLKFLCLHRIGCLHKSLPLWERGLKFEMIYDISLTRSSLPLWERGLKYFQKRSKKRSRNGRSPCGSVD